MQNHSHCNANGRYNINFTHLETIAAAPDGKMLILCHLPQPDWTRPDLIIISDRTTTVKIGHGEMSYSWSTFMPIGSVDPTLNERLVVCTGPSKAFNLQGMRTLLTIVPNGSLHRRLLNGLRNLNELFGVNILGTLKQKYIWNGAVTLDQKV